MKAKSNRILFTMVLVVMLCISAITVPAQAATDGGVNFVLIGGDGDSLKSDNNLFRQKVGHYTMDYFCKRLEFVRSIKGDYTIETAKQQGRIAENYLASFEGFNCVGGFSHGGESLFYLDMSNVDEIFLFDACTKIPKVCNTPETCGVSWSEWAIRLAASGINVHVYASNDGSTDISLATRNVIKNLDDYSNDPYYSSTTGYAIVKLDDGLYQVCSGASIGGTIEAVNVGGYHGKTCVNAIRNVLLSFILMFI